MIQSVKSFQTREWAAGMILGMGAPAGSLFLKALFSGDFSFDQLFREVSTHAFYYLYMALLTPFVFGLFGAYLGRLYDKIHSQKNSLQSMMTILEARSITDDITGLYNHRHLMDVLEKEIERSRRYGYFLSGMMIDVDDFKEINDRFGHLAGDYVLREAGIVLHESIRKTDIIGRYGGDEFMIILPHASQAAAEIVSEKILANIRQRRFKIRGTFVPLTVSIGVRFFPDAKGVGKADFIEKIDGAMFFAKEAGKNRVFVLPNLEAPHEARREFAEKT